MDESGSEKSQDWEGRGRSRHIPEFEDSLVQKSLHRKTLSPQKNHKINKQQKKHKMEEERKKRKRNKGYIYSSFH